MDINYETLFAFCSAVALLAIFPGPDNIYVLTQSLANGKKYGLATVLGLMAGCLVHTTLLAFGVSALIQTNDNLFFGIKIFGALYLFYLAYKVFVSDNDIKLSDSSVSKKSMLALFRKGFIMNVLNPKVSLFFLAFFPGFLFSYEIGNVIQFYVLGGLFIVVSSMVFGSIAILAGAISNYIHKKQGVDEFFKWIQIFVFVGLGIFILLSNK